MFSKFRGTLAYALLKFGFLILLVLVPAIELFMFGWIWIGSAWTTILMLVGYFVALLAFRDLTAPPPEEEVRITCELPPLQLNVEEFMKP